MPLRLTLRELRRSKYMTIPEVAYHANIDPATVRKYESGSTIHPQLKTVRGIANALGVTPQEVEHAIDVSNRTEGVKTRQLYKAYYRRAMKESRNNERVGRPLLEVVDVSGAVQSEAGEALSRSQQSRPMDGDPSSWLDERS